MEVSILDESRHPSVREVLLVTSTGAQFKLSEGRDGTLVVAAGVPLEVEPYSLGVVILRQVEGKWDKVKEAEGG